MKTLVYIFGQPGSGKTTLMRELCSGAACLYEANDPIRHRCYKKEKQGFIVLGGDAGVFAGTDTLSYTAIESAPVWLSKLSQEPRVDLVLAEGDRLANDKFFEVTRTLFNLLPIYLECEDSEASKRRKQRARFHNLAEQSHTWVKGRVTKHRLLASRNPDTIRLSSKVSPSDLAMTVWCRIHESR